MTKKKIKYTFSDSLAVFDKLQKMAIEEGNINLALKAEEMKCKIISLMNTQDDNSIKDDITKILVDFINDEHNGKNSADICTSDTDKETL